LVTYDKKTLISATCHQTPRSLFLMYMQFALHTRAHMICFTHELADPAICETLAALLPDVEWRVYDSQRPLKLQHTNLAHYDETLTAARACTWQMRDWALICVDEREATDKQIRLCMCGKPRAAWLELPLTALDRSFPFMQGHVCCDPVHICNAYVYCEAPYTPTCVTYDLVQLRCDVQHLQGLQTREMALATERVIMDEYMATHVTADRDAWDLVWIVLEPTLPSVHTRVLFTQ
jgi:hypothetical protein